LDPVFLAGSKYDRDVQRLGGGGQRDNVAQTNVGNSRTESA
jgi:hypothetical protein